MQYSKLWRGRFIHLPVVTYLFLYLHCLKSVQIRSFFWSVFSCIRIEYGKIGTRKNSVFGHFSRSACKWVLWMGIAWLIFQTIFQLLCFLNNIAIFPYYILVIFPLFQYKNCPYSKLFWSLFSRSRTEHGEMRSISPNSVRMRENVDQNNSE